MSTAELSRISVTYIKKNNHASEMQPTSAQSVKR